MAQTASLRRDGDRITADQRARFLDQRLGQMQAAQRRFCLLLGLIEAEMDQRQLLAQREAAAVIQGEVRERIERDQLGEGPGHQVQFLQHRQQTRMIAHEDAGQLFGHALS